MQKKEAQSKEKKAFWNAERRSRLFAIVLLSVILPVTVCVVAPFEIYCNNIAEINFTAKDFLGITVPIALGVAAILFCLLFFVPQRVYRFVYPFFVGVLLMLFIQSNYLNGSLNSLGGDDMDGANPSAWTYIWNSAVWIAVIAGVVVAFQFIKIKTITQLGALIVTVAIAATQLMNFVVVSVNTEDAFSSAIDRVYGEYEEKPRFLTNKDVATVGRDKNVVVFCVDRFDSVLYAEPAMKKYPEAFTQLDGFTYYDDAISMYGNTFPSVGYMLSGIEYANDNHKNFFERVYHDNQTLSYLRELGYSVHLYGETYYDYTNANELPDYVENAVETSKDNLKTEIRKPFNFGLSVIKTSLYRSLPFALKNTVGKVNSDTCNEYISYTSEDLQGYHAFSYDLRNAYEDLKEHDGNFKIKDEKHFSFIHVSGCHTADYDENWKKTSKKDFVLSAKNSMELIGLYIKNMKKISPELYRDSTIVILGDHGKVEKRTQPFKRAMLTALFVKPAGAADTPLATSSAPVSHENLWATIFESEGIEYDTNVWKPSVFTVEKDFNATGVYPERKFIWNKRQPNLASYDCIVYKINGKAADFDNWKIESSTFYNHPLFTN